MSSNESELSDKQQRKQAKKEKKERERAAATAGNEMEDDSSASTRDAKKRKRESTTTASSAASCEVTDISVDSSSSSSSAVESEREAKRQKKEKKREKKQKEKEEADAAVEREVLAAGESARKEEEEEEREEKERKKKEKKEKKEKKRKEEEEKGTSETTGEETMETEEEREIRKKAKKEKKRQAEAAAAQATPSTSTPVAASFSSSSSFSSAAAAPVDPSVPLKKVYPPLPPPLHPVTLLLFYQYVRPSWTPSQRLTAETFVRDTLAKNECTGRVRCAREGLNSTLTGPPEGIRAFCAALREFQPEPFAKTDFKLVDGLRENQKLRNLKVFHVNELVTYGFDQKGIGLLDGQGGTHLTPQQWHEKCMEDGTVLIDVRNANENAIGRFQPLNDPSRVLDPLMRTSVEFEEWTDQNLEKLKKAKNVLMYCTAGVRCERASCMVIEKGLEAKNVYQLDGGIHKYLVSARTTHERKNERLTHTKKIDEQFRDEIATGGDAHSTGFRCISLCF